MITLPETVRHSEPSAEARGSSDPDDCTVNGENLSMAAVVASSLTIISYVVSAVTVGMVVLFVCPVILCLWRAFITDGSMCLRLNTVVSLLGDARSINERTEEPLVYECLGCAGLLVIAWYIISSVLLFLRNAIHSDAFSSDLSHLRQPPVPR